MDGNPSVSDQQTVVADLDELFEVLADGNRRRLLGYFDDNADDVAAFSDLVEHVADESVAVSNDDHKRVAVKLHHTHLPKLEDANLVEYDPRSETVRYRGGPAVGEWVEMARAYESGSDHS
ncbi:hypothetical protein M0R88_11310 [Halorussus gelatinilyticus]|uniref:DUF7344 domain-containing protein n=1 Tax=Halorussus gelatinilyticus TaxID=2937524 RepID=A0A8U0IED1_9EURY|nr:hypothetical protein [Halorussus gelatinilyticus]UPV99114.1 hypothetical protein M0R88_11310 [Halorussus gelatinilyticus]